MYIQGHFWTTETGLFHNSGIFLQINREIKHNYVLSSDLDFLTDSN